MTGSNSASPSIQLPASLRCDDSMGLGESTQPSPDTALGVHSLAWKGSPGYYRFPVSSSSGYPFQFRGAVYGGWKAPVTLSAGVVERSIELVAPSDALLIVAPFRMWGTSKDLAEGNITMPSAYTLHGCADYAATFASLLLVRGPSCIVLRVSDPKTGASEEFRVPMYGRSC